MSLRGVLIIQIKWQNFMSLNPDNIYHKLYKLVHNPKLPDYLGNINQEHARRQYKNICIRYLINYENILNYPNDLTKQHKLQLRLHSKLPK